MSKRLILCCDGTWEQPDVTSDGQNCPTNVVKLAALLPALAADGTEQRVFYHNGIGSTARGVGRGIAGATGLGINRILKSCYLWLVRNYEPGDQIYIFGFSRGAYTARSLAGFVRNSGILRPENADHLNAAFALYRARDSASNPRAVASKLFRQSYCWSDIVPIQCIGVWDTVGSLGIPNSWGHWFLTKICRLNYEFHDTDLSSHIVFAFHAVAIDERRKPFLPTLWTQTEHGRAAKQHLEQRWFAGCHGDIGGGNHDSGLSDITLAWMTLSARKAGLSVNAPQTLDAQGFKGFHENPLADVSDSLTWFYKLFFPTGVRTIRAPISDGRTNEALHATARERWEDIAQWRPIALTNFQCRFPLELPEKIGIERTGIE